MCRSYPCSMRGVPAAVVALLISAFAAVPTQSDASPTDPAVKSAQAIARYLTARDAYENARDSYLQASRASVSGYRNVRSLLSVAKLDLNDAKVAVRDKFRADAADALTAYNSALRIARSAAERLAARAARDTALQAAALARDAELHRLIPLSPLPSR